MHRRYYLPVVSVVILLVFTKASCHKSMPDTQLGNWVGAAAIPNFPRGDASSFTIGDTAYVGLGLNESVGGMGRLNDFYSFNLKYGWTQLSNFPGAPRSNAVGFSLDNYGYFGTGFDGVTIYNDFYQYDPAANRWNPKAPLPGEPRWDAVGFGLQHLGYIGTGFNVNSMNDFYQYDPSHDSWARTPGTSGDFSKRRAAVSFVYNNQAYIVTGSNNGTMVTDFWSFDPSRQIPWKQLNAITNTSNGSFDDGYTDIKREYASVFINKNQVFLTTGKNGSLVLSTWVYDVVNDLWSRRTPYPKSGRYGSVAFTISGQSFLGTGYNGNASFDDFVQFQPDQPYNANSLN